MNHDSPESGRDPERDRQLAGWLRAGGGNPPLDQVNWERLSRRIMSRVRAAPERFGGGAGAWWEVTARWMPAAAAAGVAALLLASIALLAGRGGSSLVSDAPPETVAIARVLEAEPPEAVLTSLMDAGTREQSSLWDDR